MPDPIEQLRDWKRKLGFWKDGKFPTAAQSDFVAGRLCRQLLGDLDPIIESLKPPGQATTIAPTEPDSLRFALDHLFSAMHDLSEGRTEFARPRLRAALSLLLGTEVLP